MSKYFEPEAVMRLGAGSIAVGLIVLAVGGLGLMLKKGPNP